MSSIGIFRANSSDYSKWDIIKNKKLVECKHFNPVESKALTGDTVLENGNVSKTSEIRYNMNHYAGVLALKSPTYGRHCNKKFLYKCIPGDNSLPVFLIPYDVHEKKRSKLNTLSNVVSNYYVLFKFVEWKEKHPIGCIVDIIGPVSNMSYFYKYQIYLENLYFPKSKRNNMIRKKIKALSTQYDNKTSEHSIISAVATTVKNIKDRTAETIISIDPEGSLDLDDAFGCVQITQDMYKVSVCIANVPIWLSALEYWEHLPTTPATIYMPDIKHPMLPNILGDDLISLVQNKPRIVLAMDIYISSCGIAEKIEFNSAIINVKQNFTYNDNLHKHPVYSDLYNLAKNCNNIRRYMDSIDNSHDVVAFWMLCMNHEVGLKLQYKNTGIFRSTQESTVKTIHTPCFQKSMNVPANIVKIVHNWEKEKAIYTDAKSNHGHCYIGNGITAYAHSTSPIRRMVDIINLTRLQVMLNIIKPTSTLLNVCDYYENNTAVINAKMSAIHKIQNKCDTLFKCNSISCETKYDGYVISFEKENSIKNENKYTIFIPQLNIISFITTTQKWEVYSKKQFQIHVFHDEVTLYKKIKIKNI